MGAIAVKEKGETQRGLDPDGRLADHAAMSAPGNEPRSIARSAIGGLLLAAGRSTRFEGGDKLLATWRGERIGVHAARTLAAFAPGFRVAVCSGEISRYIKGVGFDIVINSEPERGLSSSLAIGIAYLEPIDIQAVMVCLADMPDVPLGHLDALAARFDEAARPIVASSANGIVSPPALFARRLFPQLGALQGNRGARDLLQSAALVEVDPSALHDIDRVADLKPFAAGGPDTCPA